MTKLTKDPHPHAHLPSPAQEHANAAKVAMAAKKGFTKAAASKGALRHALTELQLNSSSIDEHEEHADAAKASQHAASHAPLRGALVPPQSEGVDAARAHAQAPGGRKSALKQAPTPSGAAPSARSKGRVVIDENKNQVREFTQAPYEMGHADPFNVKLTSDQRGQYAAAVKSGTVMFHEKSGTALWPEGQMYSGQFNKSGPQRGLPHGNGVVTLRNGRAYPSSWKNGQCQHLIGVTGTDSLEDVVPAKTTSVYSTGFFDKLKGNR